MDFSLKMRENRFYILTKFKIIHFFSIVSNLTFHFIIVCLSVIFYHLPIGQFYYLSDSTFAIV